MARICADASGNICRFLKSEEEEKRYPNDPPGVACVITFDETTNQAVIDGLNADWNSHSVSGTVLLRNGTPVTINPPSLRFQDLRPIGLAIRNKLRNDEPLTTTELNRVLRFLLAAVLRD